MHDRVESVSTLSICLMHPDEIITLDLNFNMEFGIGQFYTTYAESFQLPNAFISFKIHPLALEIERLAQETFFHLL